MSPALRRLWFDPSLAVRVGVVVGALVVATIVEVIAGAAVPGRMPAFALGATFLLVFGAKRLGAFIQKPLELVEPAELHGATEVAMAEEAGDA